MLNTKFTLSAFEKTVRTRAIARGIPYPAIVQALDSVVGRRSRRWYSEAEIARALQLAERVAVSCLCDDSVLRGERETPFRATADEVVTSDTLCDALEPLVLEVRRDVFGTDSPPFETLSAALRWIRRTEKAERDALEIGRTREKVRPLMEKLGRLTGCSVSLHTSLLEFPMKRQGKIWRRCAQAMVGGNLWRLAQVTGIIAREGIAPAAGTVWVLLGMRPLVPRVKASEHVEGHCSWVRLEIRAKDLAWRELADLYKKFRSLPNLGGRKENPLHLRIFELVRARGGVPKTGQVGFWKSIQTELGGDAPGTWNAVKKAYFALRERNKAHGTESKKIVP